ncbi:MAG: DUF1217 domain-containing protein [Rhodospirillaceae bacterium]
MLTSLIAGYGSSSFGAYRVVNGRLDSLRDTFAKQPEVARELDYLRQKMPAVGSVEDLLEDPRLMQITTTAFGLEENAFAKGFFRKLLSEDSSDPASLAKRMVDPRYKEMVAFLQFDTKGAQNMKSPAWVEKLGDLYLTRSFENAAGAASPDLRDALYFQRKAPEIKSYYDILGDRTLSEVVRRAVGLPSSMSGVDLERQVTALKGKVNLEDFKNPAKLSRMVDRFLAVADAENMAMGGGMGTSPNAMALQTFSSGPMTGFAPILSIDPTLLLQKK